MIAKYMLYSSVRVLATGETGIVIDRYIENKKVVYKVEMGTIRKNGKERVTHVYQEKELEQINEWFPSP